MNQDTLAITTLVLLGIILSINLLIGHTLGTEYTISAGLNRLSQNYPIIPFILGLIVGHLFWPIMPYKH